MFYDRCTQSVFFCFVFFLSLFCFLFWRTWCVLSVWREPEIFIAVFYRPFIILVSGASNTPMFQYPGKKILKWGISPVALHQLLEMLLDMWTIQDIITSHLLYHCLASSLWFKWLKSAILGITGDKRLYRCTIHEKKIFRFCVHGFSAARSNAPLTVKHIYWNCYGWFQLVPSLDIPLNSYQLSGWFRG